MRMIGPVIKRAQIIFDNLVTSSNVKRLVFEL